MLNSNGLKRTMKSTSSKATDRDDLSRYQTRRRLYLLVGIAFLSITLLFVGSAWDTAATNMVIRGVGIVLISVGILGRMWSTLYIGGRKSDEVVLHGPYSMMRNPLYFFSSIAAAGVGAQTGTVTLAVLSGIFCVFAFLIVIKREEAFLSGTFGEAYANYCNRVPRFFPKLKLFADPKMILVAPDRIYNTLADGLVFYLAVPLLAAVSYAQNMGWLPVFVRLY